MRKSESPSLRGSGLKLEKLMTMKAKYPSPSLRGSGLKSSNPLPVTAAPFRLPLYEGVDWNLRSFSFTVCLWQSPSLRGSGLKYKQVAFLQSYFAVSLFTREWIEILPFFRICMTAWSPSLRGSGLKCGMFWVTSVSRKVSLFTREWIEIGKGHRLFRRWSCLPLYEGVDWNAGLASGGMVIKPSPSLRGSGLK